jgi:hypothetical protein
MTQKNDKIDKAKFITPVYTLLRPSGLTLKSLQFWCGFALTGSRAQQHTKTCRHILDSTLRCASPYEIAVFTY